ncbi:MAG: hypothetical protein H0X66_04600 [Verrucomicrobia bacterium]|nr:hypothetical protein [Verrucomicrobiota bacterium]
MKRVLQGLALFIGIAAVVLWIGTGANRGWTKTSREVRTLDEITEIEGIDYEKAFLPGVDFLGSALLGAGILAGVSFFVRNKQK